MTRQEIFTEQQKQESFAEYMNENFFVGWEEVMTTEQIVWYLNNWGDTDYLPF